MRWKTQINVEKGNGHLVSNTESAKSKKQYKEEIIEQEQGR